MKPLTIARGPMCGAAAALGFNLGVIYGRWEELATWQTFLGGVLALALVAVVADAIWSDAKSDT